jgi:hypothetical protein
MLYDYIGLPLQNFKETLTFQLLLTNGGNFNYNDIFAVCIYLGSVRLSYLKFFGFRKIS